MVLVRARHAAAALVALLLPAGLVVGLPATASAAAPAPVTVSLAVVGSSARIGEDITLDVTLDSSTATGNVEIDATNPDGWAAEFGAGPLEDGRLSTKIKLGRFGTWTVVAVFAGDATHQPATSAPVQVRIAASLGEVVVTEFRTSGPAGAEDSYVEITNTGRGSVPLDGFVLVSGSGTRTVLPSYAPYLGTGKSYLVVGKAFSLGAVATPDLTSSLGTEGFSVVAPDDVGTVTDAVGPAGRPHRGEPLPTILGKPTAQWAFVRAQRGGRVVDTGQNLDDFALVASEIGNVGGVWPMRGSASPSGLRDPERSNDLVRSSLLDPTVAVSALPNRRYTAGRPARLEIRRILTNTSTRSITRAKVRVTSLSEADGLPYPGGTQPALPAQLRVVNPATATTEVRFENRPSVSVQNLTLDPPATSGGGGLNSTFTVPLPSRGLAPGASVVVGFTFDVYVTGTFWFGYDVEALTSSGSSARLAATGRTTPRVTAGPVERRTAVRGGSSPRATASLVRGTL